MKILTFLHSFEPGGVERVALRLAACWQKQGLEAPVFMGRLDGAGRIAEAEAAPDLSGHAADQSGLDRDHVDDSHIAGCYPPGKT